MVNDKQPVSTTTCIICGATFRPRGNQKRTCSHACAQKYNHLHSSARRRITQPTTTETQKPPAATPTQPRPLTMAERAKLLRQAIENSAFQQQARAELDAVQSLFVPEDNGLDEFDNAQKW